MQFGTSISVFHVRSGTAESAVISRPAYSVYISIAYHMQKRGGGEVACKIAYILNGRPLYGAAIGCDCW